MIVEIVKFNLPAGTTRGDPSRNFRQGVGAPE